MRGTEALEKILDGNRRFVEGKRTATCNAADFDLEATVHSQHPMAAVLSCSDLRIPPEQVLDSKVGEVLVIRVAGKVPDTAVIGSLEYALKHHKVPLILVLGHEGCGAVKAALEAFGNRTDGALGELIRELEPAVRPVLDQVEKPDDLLDEAVHASIWYTMNRILQNSPIIAAAVIKQQLLLKGAFYSLKTGKVTLLEGEG